MKHATLLATTLALSLVATGAFSMNKKEMAEKLAKKAEMSQSDETPNAPSDVKSEETGEEAGLLLPAVQKVRSSASKSESTGQDTAAPPRQTKGLSLPTNDPQGPVEPTEPEEGTAPQEPKKEEALHHLRKAYD
ncbi:MAG: hypothetical protein ACPG06_03235 [Alphaproteobacteria bacterium]